MAYQVVVIDSSAHRATVRITPATHLTEVLQEASRKLGRNPDSHDLKYQNKVLDLGLSFRLCGLANGVKLELVQRSRSPSVVSVAIQLPEPVLISHQYLGRLTAKFPSTTSLWMTLRHFESSANDEEINFTERKAPNPDIPDAFLYQTPVLHIMNKDYSSFAEQQKTLAQIGFNSGTLLIRLSFRTATISFEQAKQQISRHFADQRGEVGFATASSPSTATIQNVDTETSEGQAFDGDSSMAALAMDKAAANEHNSPSAEAPQDHVTDTTISMTICGVHRDVTILAAPTNNIPQAARQVFNEDDYVPSVEHARKHQSRLSIAGTNRKLLSDAELATQVEDQHRHLESVREVEIKFRFPDQMQSVSKFYKRDTAQSALNFVQGLMTNGTEPIDLLYNYSGGMKSMLMGNRAHLKLIEDLKLEGRVLVNVVWKEGASVEARLGPVLKEQYRQQAREIIVPPPQMDISPDTSHSTAIGKKGLEGPTKRKGGIPKWLKLPGQK